MSSFKEIDDPRQLIAKGLSSRSESLTELDCTYSIKSTYRCVATSQALYRQKESTVYIREKLASRREHD